MTPSPPRRSGPPQKGGRGRAGPPPRRIDRPSTHTRKHDPAHLSDDIVRELQATARPGKGEILIQVFSEAVGAFMAGDPDEAIRLGEQAKHIALRSTTVREFLGLGYYHAERWKQAASELSTFRRISGSADQNPVLGDCYRAMEKPQRALELCDEVVPGDSDPSVFYEAAIVGAGALADMGRVDEAIARLERLELRPEAAEEHHLRAWYVLADLLARRGRYTQAREWFEAVAAVDPELTDAPERAARL
ncbi:MAG: tetratricopeptide repeat protein [Actinobacteria bacterium]|nr:tetratricopeptide repeat protein [Actinomycetota bacterium]